MFMSPSPVKSGQGIIFCYFLFVLVLKNNVLDKILIFKMFDKMFTEGKIIYPFSNILKIRNC